MRHYRCMLCRRDCGRGTHEPQLCEDCTTLVGPYAFDHEANEEHARGYAAALWHAFCVKHKQPHEPDPPRDPDGLRAWCLAR